MADMRINIREELRQWIVYLAPFYGICNIFMLYGFKGNSFGRVPTEFLLRYPYYRFRATDLALCLAAAYIASGLIAILWRRGLFTVWAVAIFHLGMTLFLAVHKTVCWHDVVVPLVAIGAGGWVMTTPEEKSVPLERPRGTLLLVIFVMLSGSASMLIGNMMSRVSYRFPADRPELYYQLVPFRDADLAVYGGLAYFILGILACYSNTGIYLLMAAALAQIGFFGFAAYYRMVEWNDLIFPLIILAAAFWILKQRPRAKK